MSHNPIRLIHTKINTLSQNGEIFTSYPFLDGCFINNFFFFYNLWNFRLRSKDFSNKSEIVKSRNLLVIQMLDHILLARETYQHTFEPLLRILIF